MLGGQARSGDPVCNEGRDIARGIALNGVMFPIPKHNQEMVKHARALIESGEFKPVVDRTYPLDNIAEAYHYVETGQKIGNVVISVAPPQ